MKQSFKNIIQKYIVLKINSYEWSPKSKIPSENQLAAQFNCSRLTIRNALQSLVYSGVLNAKKGVGYFISETKHETSVRSFSLSHKSTDTKIKIMKNDVWLKEFFELDSIGREVSLFKEYYDDDGYMAAQFTILNKNIIWEIKENDIKDSMTKYLANQGVAIQYQDIDVKLCLDKHIEIIEIARKLGWDGKYIPIEIIRSYSQEGWLENTIRVSRPDALKIHFTKRNYS